MDMSGYTMVVQEDEIPENYSHTVMIHKDL